LGEIALLDCVASQQVVTEVERNLGEKLPAKLPEFRLIVSRALRVVPDPFPEDLASYAGQADPKDLPILVAALREGCSHLLTFNVRHFMPDLDRGSDIVIKRPGEFLLDLRDRLSTLK
jgi:hypothetical protein